MQLLVTGGTGYIGTHTVIELINAGHDVVVLDSLVSSSAESLVRVEQITGQRIAFIEGDIRDRALLDRLFANHDFSAVLHFAGLKAVGESVSDPLKYYDVNVSGTVALCQAMNKAGVRSMVYSSSATVYGEPTEIPISETCPTRTPTSPYGHTKLLVEEILRALYTADQRWRVALLRYFNPIGAHESGLIGEDPNDTPNNLMPLISRVAVGRMEKLVVYGNDYPTQDGTGVRDYIHVMDLAAGHVAALKALHDGVQIWNLGTGKGYSVLEMIHAFEEVSGRKIPHEVVARRPGDIAECYANPDKATRELGWRAERDLRTMIEDTWRWQSRNPDGYKA